MLYQVTTKARKTFAVDSALTDAEAQAVLADKENASPFEKSLAGKSRLTPKMRAWLHVLASWAVEPRKEPVNDSFPLILAMLQKTRDDGNKKFPKVRLQIEGQIVQLGLSQKGTVNVTDGRGYNVNKYFGAIQPNGSFREGKSWTADVSKLLREVEADAVSAVKRYSTGQCCFCRLELTTLESRTAGYGKTCAKNHGGLPWGHIDPELRELPKRPLQMPYY